MYCNNIYCLKLYIVYYNTGCIVYIILKEIIIERKEIERGGMYQGGEDALQATCGGFDSHPLH